MDIGKVGDGTIHVQVYRKRVMTGMANTKVNEEKIGRLQVTAGDISSVIFVAILHSKTSS